MKEAGTEMCLAYNLYEILSNVKSALIALGRLTSLEIVRSVFLIHNQEQGHMKDADRLEVQNVFYIDLSTDLQSGRPFDGMAVGTFLDLWGKKITIKKSELETYIKNTKNAIASTETESGEVVGLPIDAQGHDAGDGAGWIQDVFLEQVEKPNGKKIDIIRFVAEWTELGLKLIQSGVRRMFSPTFDYNEKVILGGSLTNWPATRSKTGEILLRPIELSSNLFTPTEAAIEENQAALEDEDPPADLEQSNQPKDGGNTMDVKKVKEAEGTVEATAIVLDTAQREAMIAEMSGVVGDQMKTSMKEMLAELIAPKDPEGKEGADSSVLIPNLLAMLELDGVNEEFQGAIKESMLAQWSALQEKAKVDAVQMITAVRRESTIADFCSSSISGSTEVPRGLPTKQDELVAFCNGLDDKQFEFFSKLTGRILNEGLTEFEELGHGRKPKGQTELPEYYVTQLEAGSIKLADLKDPIIAADLGNLDQYDLSKFDK